MVEGIEIPRSAPRGPFLALLCLVAFSFAGLSHAEEPLPTPISGSLAMLEDDAMAGFSVVEEKELSTETFHRLQEAWNETESNPDRKALANLCHILINSAEFIYID